MLDSLFVALRWAGLAFCKAHIVIENADKAEQTRLRNVEY